MAKEELAAMVQKEFDLLNVEKLELLKKVAEIDKKMVPLIAFMDAGKKSVVTGKKRGRKPKTEKAPEQTED